MSLNLEGVRLQVILHFILMYTNIIIGLYDIYLLNTETKPPLILHCKGKTHLWQDLLFLVLPKETTWML